MNRINLKTTLLASALAAVALLGCGDDKASPDAARTIDGSRTADAPTIPAAPVLGTQIDRMGRPAVNTALNHAFDGDATAKQAAKDAYNAAASPGSWATTGLGATGDVVATQFEANLGIIDSLDSSASATGCSSAQSDPTLAQPLYNKAGTGGAAYQGLAGALADDELYVYTSTGTCKTYLAVEGATILKLSAPTDCGGRAPSYQVMKISYTVMAIGLGPVLATPPTLISDGPIAGDDAGGNATASTDDTFPFIGAPH